MEPQEIRARCAVSSPALLTIANAPDAPGLTARNHAIFRGPLISTRACTGSHPKLGVTYAGRWSEHPRSPPEKRDRNGTETTPKHQLLRYRSTVLYGPSSCGPHNHPCFGPLRLVLPSGS